MKIIFGSRRDRHLARVCVFLIMAVLIAGMAGCDGNRESYTLTITSTPGGSVVGPGEGTFTYYAGTEVDLVTETEEGYQFVNWTGNVSTIADVNADTTTITVNGDYSITANFAIAIEIWDWYDLDAVRYNLAGNYTLMNDLDSTTAGYEELTGPTANGGKGWRPIGNETDRFTGALDGQGHEIRDLFINRPDEITIGIGLFAFVNEGGIIKSVGVVNASVTGYIFVGSLVGANAGTVINSYFTGSVTGTGNGMYGSTVGGLLGQNGGVVSNSYSTGSVFGETIVGGLVGMNGGGAPGIVSNSYSSSNVTGVDDVGGLVGWNGGGVSPGGVKVGTVQATSAGGTGKTTAEMMDIATFTGAAWNITDVDPGETNPSYIWNIVDAVTYPFLSWQP
jgi:hypothetical protein